MEIYRLTILLTLMLAFQVSNFGQNGLSIKLFLLDTTEQSETMNWQEIFPEKIDPSEVRMVADSIRTHLVNGGYLSSSVDSIAIQDTNAVFYLYTGQQYSLEDIIISQSNQALLEGSGIERTKWSSMVLNHKVTTQIKSEVLSHLANIGYPFASVYFDKISIEDDRVTIALVVDKGPIIMYDTLVLKGNANVKKSFLQKLLLLNEGAAYSQKDVLEIKNRLKDLSFIELKQNPIVSFINEKALVQLHIEPRNSSRFDFIIGVLPLTTGGTQKWTITGDFTGELINKLGSGERFFAQFRRLRPETQNLDIQISYPYFLQMPFGVEGKFLLFRNSNQFLEVVSDLSIFYPLSGRDQFSIGWDIHSSRLIEVNSNAILQSRTLPDQLDVRVVSGKAGLVLNKLDDLFNPTRGWSLRINLLAGQKKIIPNLTIIGLSNEEVDYNEQYNSLVLSTFQMQFQAGIEKYFDVRQWATIRLANRSAVKFNQEGIYDNEFFRIGGNRILRGFNEETIFTPAFSIFTAEFRILLDRMSFLSLPFIDYGVFNVRNDTGELIMDRGLGVGIGLNFATQAGIFNIAFAAGNRSGRGFDFNDTKIHFGYLSMF